MSQNAVTLRFHYFEVMDHDFTLVWVELSQNGKIIQTFTNFPKAWQDSFHDEVYGNQSETFVLPAMELAREMMRSNPDYRETGGIKPWHRNRTAAA